MKTCLEIKENLLGQIKEYSCELIYHKKNISILKYIIKNKKNVKNILILPEHTVTLAFYWPDRNYNVYTWFDKKKKNLGYYFNIIDKTELSEKKIYYHDLLVDVIITPEGKIHIVDRNELPEDIDKKLLRHINTIEKHIKQNYKNIINEVNTIIKEMKLP